MDLLMVRERSTGRFVYTERMERRVGETPWEYARRSVRREGQIRARFAEEEMQVIVGWGTDSVEEFLREHPEYGSRGIAGDGIGGGRLEGDRIDQ